ncbi:MAG TPA: hypothetical protein VMT31_06835 [Methanomicrobiales archaeon]|nr:hypothetical protein [Methanomicrobiales archaeon]
MEPDPGDGKLSPEQPAAPQQPQPEARPGVPPDWKNRIMIGIAIVAVVLVAAAILPGLLTGRQPAVSHPIGSAVTPTATLRVPGTATPERTPLPGETLLPAITGTTPAVTCVPAGEPDFTVTVSPVEATAARGQTVNYRMTIEARNCFAEPVSMKLTASVLFFLSNMYDLGTQEPPYPKTFEYTLTVPDSLFPGATVNGVLTSTGGGITRENQLTLHVS